MVRDVTWYRLDKDILAASDTQGSVMESGGFRNTGGARRTGGGNFNRSGSIPQMISGGQALMMEAPPGSKAGEIVTTPDGQQCLVMPDGKTMSPLIGGTPIPPGSPDGNRNVSSDQMNAMMA